MTHDVTNQRLRIEAARISRHVRGAGDGCRGCAFAGQRRHPPHRGAGECVAAVSRLAVTHRHVRRPRLRRRPSWRGRGKAARRLIRPPAIVDGVVYVGTATGELIAVGLADGKLRWRYKAGEAIGESSPAVANGRVFIGDLIGVVHAVNVADGKPVWTFKTQSEIKSSPVVVGDVVLMGSYDGSLYGLDAATGKQLLGVQDRELRARHAVRRQRRRALRRLRRSVSCRRRRRPARSGSPTSATAYTGASVALVNGVAYFGTFDNQVLALDLEIAQGAVALRASRSQVSVLLVGGGGRRHRRPRRPRSHGARARREDRQGALDLHDARAHRLVAGDCRRPRLRRIERRPLLRAGSGEREGGVAARRGRGAHARRPPSPVVES